MQNPLRFPTAEMIQPAVGADRDVMAAVVVAAIDQHMVHAGFAQLGEGDLFAGRRAWGGLYLRTLFLRTVVPDRAPRFRWLGAEPTLACCNAIGLSLVPTEAFFMFSGGKAETRAILGACSAAPRHFAPWPCRCPRGISSFARAILCGRGLHRRRAGSASLRFLRGCCDR